MKDNIMDGWCVEARGDCQKVAVGHRRFYKIVSFLLDISDDNA